MDSKSNAIAALTRNGLERMFGVRGDTYAYRSDGLMTYVDIKGSKFYAEGYVEHLPMMMGYSEDEVRKAVHDITCDHTAMECIVDMLKSNRKESGC